MMKLNIPTAQRQAQSVSIMQSRRQIEQMQSMAGSEIYSRLSNDEKYEVLFTKRQVTSGLIIDWKQFDPKQSIKSQLIVKNGIHDNQNQIFSYIVVQWFENQPIKVCYRWVRKPANILQKIQGELVLKQEQHMYRGEMNNYKKHGRGQYIIIKKYIDNSEKIQRIDGIWENDILIKGQLVDQKGFSNKVQNQILSFKSMKEKSRQFIKQNSIIKIQKERRKTTKIFENAKFQHLIVQKPKQPQNNKKTSFGQGNTFKKDRK